MCISAPTVPAVPAIESDKFWEIHGEYYDLTPFFAKHPGGRAVLEITRGTDCTTLFESVHLFDQLPKATLKKFHVGSNPAYAPTIEWHKGFYSECKKRVQEHFKDTVRPSEKYQTARKEHHGTCMYQCLVWCLFVTFWTTVYLSLVKRYWAATFLFGPLAFSMGGVGHEALHFGTFSSRFLNRAISFFTLDCAGISSYVYFNVHCCGHHLFTNTEGVDPDIEVHYSFVRLSQYQKREAKHAYQCFYIYPVYVVSLIVASILDVKSLFEGFWGHPDYPHPVITAMGNSSAPGVPLWEFLGAWIGKIVYYSVFYIMPHFFADSHGEAALRTFAMIGIGSLITTNSFAVSHQVKKCMADKQALEDYRVRDPQSNRIDWGAFQVATTADFQTRIWEMLHIGGLAFQVEHHLFPTISICRLPEVRKVVREVCKEYGLEYNFYSSYFAASKAHFMWLREIGNNDVVFADQSGPGVNVPPPRPLKEKRSFLEEVLFGPDPAKLAVHVKAE